MVFGVESPKKNGMQPAIDSLHLSVFAQSLSANHFAHVNATGSL
jgi:hypothetical protein